MFKQVEIASQVQYIIFSVNLDKFDPRKNGYVIIGLAAFIVCLFLSDIPSCPHFYALTE